MANKKTVVEKFEEVAKVLETVKANPELIEFINERAELHSKRNSKKATTLTKTQKENEKFVAEINDWFFTEANPEVAYTSKEVAEALNYDFTPQKMTALLKKADVERIEKATNDNKKVGYKAQ